MSTARLVRAALAMIRLVIAQFGWARIRRDHHSHQHAPPDQDPQEQRSAMTLWTPIRLGSSPRADAAGLGLSAGSRMKATIRWARWLTVLRRCHSSAARGSVACGGPVAEGVGE
jgi:hypothetical protein